MKDTLDGLQSHLIPDGALGADAFHLLASTLAAAIEMRLAGAGDDVKTQGGIQGDSCTSHISVVDSQGTAVALTQTLLSPFGAKIVLPETGILMNNGMMWFDPRPGNPNSIGPGKRPLSNMCPAIVEIADGLRVALGASGGRRIMPAVLQLISFLVDHRMSVNEAIHHPRIDVGGTANVVIDSRLSDAVYEALDADFDVSWANHGVYPVLFACPNIVAWDSHRKRGLGAAFVSSPRAVVAQPGS